MNPAFLVLLVVTCIIRMPDATHAHRKERNHKFLSYYHHYMTYRYRILASGESTLAPNTKPAAGFESVNVTGKVTLYQIPYLGTLIKITAKGLSPNSAYGFHVHEYGDITSNGCQSAGGHYNPFQLTHSGRSDYIRHVGDLGNVVADKRGEVKISFLDHQVKLLGRDSVFGRSFVLHALRDDIGRGKGEKRAESLKTGNAGSRLACGVIVHSNVTKKTRI